MSRRNPRLFLLVFLLSTGVRALFGQLAVGDRFPDLASMGLEGKLPATENRVLVVDFWASWCAPCKMSFPALSRLQSDYERRAVIVLGLSVDQKAADYSTFLKSQSPVFSVARDAAKKLVTAVQVPAMPASYVIGRDGRIRAIIAGYHGKSTDTLLRTELDRLLAESPAS